VLDFLDVIDVSNVSNVSDVSKFFCSKIFKNLFAVEIFYSEKFIDEFPLENSVTSYMYVLIKKKKKKKKKKNNIIIIYLYISDVLDVSLAFFIVNRFSTYLRFFTSFRYKISIRYKNLLDIN